jgi:putative drug exporter of the RND superfamily
LPPGASIRMTSWALTAPVWMEGDQGNDPTTTTTRRAHDLTVAGFGADPTGPFAVVMDTRSAGAAAAVPKVLDALRATPGVASVTPAQVAPLGPRSPSSSRPPGPRTRSPLPSCDTFATTSCPGRRRAPGAGQRRRADGERDRLRRRHRSPAPLVHRLGAGPVVPAAAGPVPLGAGAAQGRAHEAASIGAAYGVLVAVFQWGWAGQLLGVDGHAPIEPWAPMMLLAIVFGLSMDYEVFLLTAVRESYDGTGDNAEATIVRIVPAHGPGRRR